MQYGMRHFKVYNFAMILQACNCPSFLKYVCFLSYIYILLYMQVDPLEKLEPEVADILVDIAENFLESVSIFILFYFVHWADGIVHFLQLLLGWIVGREDCFFWEAAFVHWSIFFFFLQVI